ncbi:hypothetical protein MPER_06086, partial [Moniliophthora perniciosa FA553]
PDKHFPISASQKDSIDLHYWTQTNNKDPSLMNFKQDLQAHLLQRLRGDPSDTEYHLRHLRLASIANNKIYEHKTMRLYYSTYDLRRMQDTISIRTHPDIMMLSNDKSSPYLFGQVVGIYHLHVTDLGEPPSKQFRKKMEVLWVRWYHVDAEYRWGWKANDSRVISLSTESSVFITSIRSYIRYLHPELAIDSFE